ncbi:hypothetical protein [Rufibacter ruber]|uniref:DUF6712 family protein n=1 Tax=Rufibacter ruber TaxID=1783499 RepID=UPI000831D87D|nr:hypothetical protein [Rufibacter ruber]
MYLIDEAYLKSRVNIAVKDSTVLKISFQNVTDFYLQELLSIPLYDLLLDHTQNDTAITPKQTELLAKVKAYFALMVHYDLIFNLFEVNNKGNKVEADAPSVELMKMQRSEVLSKAEQMKSYIERFLNDNRGDFPQYFSNEQPDAPKPTSGVSPIVFLDEPKIWIGG